MIYEDYYQKLSNCIRILTVDAIQHAKSGHAGMVLGMADIMTCLAFEFLKFNPHDPKWLNRDRLILSCGHGSMLLYSFYYLAGYINFTLDDIKQFRSLHSKTPGHPEYRTYNAIEATTGPLGQGLAMAVGMAIAQKKYQTTLNCNYNIYCIVSDGCLMEGISYEAASLAGHLCLNNLIVIFDSNKITIDGSTDLTISENQALKFIALGWHVYEIDGHNFNDIRSGLRIALNANKPCLLISHTVIAKGCVLYENTNNAHSGIFDNNEIIKMKHSMNFDLKKFFIPQQLKNMWESAWTRNEILYNQDQISKTSITKLNLNNISLNHSNINDNISTRASSGLIMHILSQESNRVIFGSADLSESNHIKNKANSTITYNNFSGNFIHYGIREHAMTAIMNGLALSDFLPIGGTFLTFCDYMKPAIRLAAMMRLHVIYVATHDSIAVGQDGPTHQPVEQLACFRSIPNLLVFRPADHNETIKSWQLALNNNYRPSMIVLTKQNVKQITPNNASCKHGAYFINKSHLSNIRIFATGSELAIAIDIKQILANNNIIADIVSIICFELLFEQNPKYIADIINFHGLKIAIEASSCFGWHRIIGTDGIFFGIDTFGVSGTSDDVYEHFELTANKICTKIYEHLDKHQKIT